MRQFPPASKRYSFDAKMVPLSGFEFPGWDGGPSLDMQILLNESYINYGPFNYNTYVEILYPEIELPEFDWPPYPPPGDIDIENILGDIINSFLSNYFIDIDDSFFYFNDEGELTINSDFIVDLFDADPVYFNWVEGTDDPITLTLNIVAQGFIDLIRDNIQSVLVESGGNQNLHTSLRWDVSDELEVDKGYLYDNCDDILNIDTDDFNWGDGENPVLTLENPVDPIISGGFWAKINGTPVADGTNRWRYPWIEVVKSSTGYGGWVVDSSVSGESARNTIEDMNVADGELGIGVHTDDLDTADWTATLKPAPEGAIVWMRPVVVGTLTEYWFSYENSITVVCD